MYPMQEQQQPQPQPSPAPGGGGGGAPAPGGAQGGQDQMHPEIAKNLKPDDPVQGYLLQNIDQLSPQEVAALKQGMTPPMAQVLSKIAPCVAFVFQKLASGQGGAPQPGGAPAPAPEQQDGGGASAAPPPGGLQRPATALGRMQA